MWKIVFILSVAAVVWAVPSKNQEKPKVDEESVAMSAKIMECKSILQRAGMIDSIDFNDKSIETPEDVSSEEIKHEHHVEPGKHGKKH